jgi:mevalonate kinase
MENKGYGKAILFGEHFVVYGIPSIVSAISMATEAKVDIIDKPGWTLQDDRPATPSYKDDKREHQEDSINRIIKAAGVNLSKKGIHIWLGGDLYAASGVGASAASCTAVARALNETFKLGFDDAKINELAYEGEKGYHGDPSGLDNTASTYGGLLWFVRGEQNHIEKLKLREPVEIVLGNTGMVANTKAAVAGVKERKEESPEEYEEIFGDAFDLILQARRDIENFDMKDLGRLMNRNHELLQEIEVSNDKLDYLVDLARSKGAWGAKMTGGGLGGYMLALTPGKELQDDVALAIQEEGYRAVKATIGI